jgi:hypothetical protein
MRTRGKFSLARLGIVLAAVSVLAACTKGGQFDPTTLLDNDMFDNKKPVTGQREPVFPGGVPGISSGIPQDLYKGYQPPPDQAADSGAAEGLPPGEAPAGPPQQAAVETQPVPAPAPKPKTKVARKPVHRRTEVKVGLNKQQQPKATSQSAPQAEQTAWPAPPPTTGQAQSSEAWPAPGGGTQQAAQPSQSIWPNPPPTGTQ